jgi:hypothetical protein
VTGLRLPGKVSLVPNCDVRQSSQYQYCAGCVNWQYLLEVYYNIRQRFLLHSADKWHIYGVLAYIVLGAFDNGVKYLLIFPIVNMNMTLPVMP